MSTSTSCALCKAQFATVPEQREHVRSDLHRYNLKMKMKGLNTMDEGAFSKAIGDLDESISGSESSSSDEDVSEGKPLDSTLSALLRRQAKIAQKGADDERTTIGAKRGPGKPPIYWLKSPKLPQGSVVGIYRALFSVQEQEEANRHLIDSLKSKQLKPLSAKNSGKASNSSEVTTTPHVFLCMMGGGHFAAMIVALAPEIMKKAGGIEERHARVLAHKTFHRYTTRRKQGGAQSANDNSKGNAHSAGSSLRRYNEAALENDIRSVLSEWKSMIDSSELLFIRATGSTNRRTLFGPYEGQVLRNNDPRIRGFPFSTRRATQSELMRSFTELTRLKVSTITEVAPKESTPTASAKSSTPRPSTPTPKLTSEEEAMQLHTNQITALMRRSKAPALLSYLSNNSLSPSMTFFPPNHHAPTPLHLAASSNSPALVIALLTKPSPTGADPTSLNGEGKTPFDLAGNLETRDAFRIARSTLGESAWDWSAAHVPSAMSREESDARIKREQQLKKEEEAQRRKEDLDKLKREEDERQLNRVERKAGKGQALGGMVEKTAADVREEEGRGLTPEMKMRLERERRARAAEERLRRMQGK